MKPCSYFRISREDTALEKFAVKKYKQKALDYGVPQEYIFYDFASGGNSDRASYQKVIELIKTGERDEVVVPMQSRLNRNLLNSELLAEDLAKAGAKLTVLETGSTLDLNCPTDRLIYQLRAIFDHQELSKYQQTNQDNANQMRKDLKVWAAPFGYTVVRGKPKIDREPYICLLESERTVSPADILEHLIELVLKNRAIKSSIREFNVFYGIPEYLNGQIRNRQRKPKQFDFSSDRRFKHRKTLRFTHHSAKKILSNPILVGDVRYFFEDKNRETVIYPGINPDQALLSRKQFAILQTAMGERTYSKPRKNTYPMSGLVYCGVCGARCYSDRGGKRGKDGNRRILYYLCKNRLNAIESVGCPTKRIRADVIEELLFKELTKRNIAISQLAQTDDLPTSPELIKLELQLQQLSAMPDNKFILQAISDTKVEIEKLRLEQASGSEVHQDNLELLQSIFANPLYWETLTQSDRREIYQLLVKKIVVGMKDGSSCVERFDLLV